MCPLPPCVVWVGHWSAAYHQYVESKVLAEATTEGAQDGD